MELATEVVLEPMSSFSGRIEKFKDAGYFHDIPMSWSLEILARYSTFHLAMKPIIFMGEMICDLFL